MIVVVPDSDDWQRTVGAEEPAKSGRGANSFLQLVSVERRAVILKH
jgi:hypothetical protein